MKYKVQIIGLVILCAVGGAMFATWQFHFKAIFAQYRADDTMRETLERSLAQLEETFQGYKPELLIEEWQNNLQPWRNAREERAGYFNYGDWFDIDIKPDEMRMLKFWYTEELNKMTLELYRKVYEKMGGYDRFPQDIRAVFGIQGENDFAGRDITMKDVNMNLSYLQYATSLTELLLDSNVISVDSIVHWPRRVPNMFEQLLVLQTVGLNIKISARDFVRMMDKLQQEPRYFTVDCIRINYPYISYQAEPQLNVSMLLTQANYRKPAEQTGGAAAGPGGPTPTVAGRPAVARPEEPGTFARAWIWFKRNILVMN